VVVKRKRLEEDELEWGGGGGGGGGGVGGGVGGGGGGGGGRGFLAVLGGWCGNTYGEVVAKGPALGVSPLRTNGGPIAFEIQKRQKVKR